MESIVIIEVLTTAAVTITAAALLGFLTHRLMGLLILAAASGLACGITVTGWALGFQLAGARRQKPLLDRAAYHPSSRIFFPAEAMKALDTMRRLTSGGDSEQSEGGGQ